MRYGFIYMIRNKINGKVYIGQTTKKTFGGRYSSGKWWLQTHNLHLKKAAEKYGFENFEISMLAECVSQEELNKLEKDFIISFDSLNPLKGYNKSINGLSEEDFDELGVQIYKRKCSERMKVLHQDPVHRAFVIELLQKNRSAPDWKQKVRDGIQKYHEENKLDFAEKNSRAWTPERREKARQQMLIRNQDPDFKAKVVENGKKVQSTEAAIQRRIQNFTKYNSNPDVIERKRQEMIKRNQDPDYQAKCKAGINKRHKKSENI